MNARDTIFATPLDAATPASGHERRLPELDGLRAISILLVLAAHLLPVGPKILSFNSASGAMGMSLFFALSGFLITQKLIDNPDIFDFLVRRLARIVPLLWLYVVLLLAFFEFDLPKFGVTALFGINYWTEYIDGYNAHLWSLCVEMHFYVFVALLVALLGRRGLLLLFPLCLAITIWRISDGQFISIKTHHRVDEILSGACIAWLYCHNRLSLGQFRWLLPAAFLGLFACSLLQSGALQYLRPYAGALVLAAAITSPLSVFKRLLHHRVLAYVAAISYALYVFHPITASGWLSDDNKIVKYLIKRPISFALTFGLAHLSTFYWEKHWIAAAKNFLRRRRAALRKAEA
jgi:peptidoglycan/LPS O-acetylase OafA/YrhL